MTKKEKFFELLNKTINHLFFCIDEGEIEELKESEMDKLDILLLHNAFNFYINNNIKLELTRIELYNDEILLIWSKERGENSKCLTIRFGKNETFAHIIDNPREKSKIIYNINEIPQIDWLENEIFKKTR